MRTRFVTLGLFPKSEIAVHIGNLELMKTGIMGEVGRLHTWISQLSLNKKQSFSYYANSPRKKLVREFMFS